VTPMGVVTTLAGEHYSCGSVDGAVDVARFCSPSGIAADSAGNLFVADTDNGSIRKMRPIGSSWVVAKLVGAPPLSKPTGVAVDSAGNLFVADSGNHTIQQVTAAGVVTTLAGSTGTFGTNDGIGAAARFNCP
ncbi:MAG: hypothetical protein NTW03_04225, partial [Verrucomicrobia bacterium]|nr:hypothetical protein [Verrucomicrobiota bacterium]